MLIEFSLLLIALSAGSTALFCKGDLLGGSVCALTLAAFFITAAAGEIRANHKGVK